VRDQERASCAHGFVAHGIGNRSLTKVTNALPLHARVAVLRDLAQLAQ
jgi:hypothetical protein